MYLKIYEIDLARFLTVRGLGSKAAFQKNKVELDLLTDIDMLSMVEKAVTVRICHSICWYTKTNIRYMKNYDKNKESTYLKYCDANNWYGWAMSQKLLVNKFEWLQDTSQFSEDVMKNYNEEIDEGYFLEVHVQYPEKLHELHSGLPFLPELMKVEIVEKLVANLQTDKTENVMHIRNLKQALNHGLVLKKSHRIFIFKQKAWLKSYIDMNIDLRRNAKIFEKDLKKKNFGKLWKKIF